MTPNLPPHAYIPGGPYPRPTDSSPRPIPLDPSRPLESAAFTRGLDLFHAGYYWEAHEVWESLWHVHDRTGPIADTLKALILLAAACVKVRQRQPHGVSTHAQRARLLLERLNRESGPIWLALDLPHLIQFATSIEKSPPTDSLPITAPVSIVHPMRLHTDAQNKVINS